MKTIAAVIFFVLAKAIFSQSGWFNQNILTNPLISLSFINNNTGFTSNYNGILRTTNGGVNWSYAHSSSNIYVYDIQFIDNITGYAAGQTNNSTGPIYKTTNSGQNWSEFNIPGIPIYTIFMNIHFINNNTGYILSYNFKLCKTTNGGLNWSVTNLPVSSTWTKGLWFLNENTGFVGGSVNTFIKTTNGGVNWSPVNTGIFGNFENRLIYFVNSNTGFAPIIGNGGDTLLKTTDGGISWVKKAIASTGGWNAMSMLNNGKGYIAGDGFKMAKTTNFGESWSLLNMPSVPVNDFKGIAITSDDTAYAVMVSGYQLKTTSGGVFVGINPVNNEIPTAFKLHQNYPNPFNPATKLKFDIPKSSFVKITVFDILGREVRVIANQNMSAGSYETEFNATALPSGVYFYKIETRQAGSSAGEFTQIRKMILVK